jgi:malic enzyme
MAAADAIAQLARPDELVPDPLDKSVHERVASAVRDAAVMRDATGETELVFEPSVSQA